MTTTVETPPTGSVGTPLHARPVIPAQTETPPSPSHRRPRTMEQVSRTEKIVAYTLLILGSLLFLVPFYFVVNASLKSEAQVNAGEFASPPKSLTEVRFSNYPRALAPDKMNFWPALSNTVVITVVCVVGQ